MIDSKCKYQNTTALSGNIRMEVAMVCSGIGTERERERESIR